MGTLKFSDGVEINTDGPLRIIHLDDGYYVTGEGTLIPCRDQEEADEILNREKGKP